MTTRRTRVTWMAANIEEILVADTWETGGNLAGGMLLGSDDTLYVGRRRDRICGNGSEDNSLRMRRRTCRMPARRAAVSVATCLSGMEHRTLGTRP